MRLSIESFAAFFEEFRGYEPFAWQVRLLEHIITTGAWPDVIDAPTGSGKTSVIDVHAFVNALAGQDHLNLPRRLVMTVNRRSLVDDHAEHARFLGRKLNDAVLGAAEGSVLGRVAQLLTTRDVSLAGGAGEPLAVHVIRGGRRLDRDWRARPAACAVLCMTPDMFGSRLLFRGYGTSRAARPLEAGLLGRDTVLVVDEAHQNRQLLKTARRVAELDAMAEFDFGVPRLQVVATTATPSGTGGGDSAARSRVGVDETGVLDQREPVLARRLTTPKPVELRVLDIKRSQEAGLVKALADAAEELAKVTGPGEPAVGCVVNTVKLAVALTKELGARAESDQAVATVIGGLPRHYAKHVTARLSGSSIPGEPGEAHDDQLKFVVGTQALEVGIDIDLSALVTELAPGAAIAQRAGRVNRYGLRERGPVTVLVPEYPRDAAGVPYEVEDLEASLAWLQELARSPDGLAVTALRRSPPPDERLQRRLLQRVEWPEAQRLSRTSERLFVTDPRGRSQEEDLTLWLRDGFTEQVEAAAVFRSPFPTDPALAAQAIRSLPPLDDELFKISLSRIRQLAQGDSTGDASTILAVRGGEPFVVEDPREIRPGDTLVLSEAGSGDTLPVLGVGRRQLLDLHDELILASAAGTEAARRGCWQFRALIHKVTEARGGKHETSPETEAPKQPDRNRTDTQAKLLAGLVAWRELEERAGEADADLEDVHAEAIVEAKQEALRLIHDALTAGSRHDWLSLAGAVPEELRELQSDPGSLTLMTLELLMTTLEEEAYAIVRFGLDAVADEDQRDFTGADVPLQEHSEAVAGLTSQLAAKVGMSEAVRRDLVRAAKHHDDGKRHPRFQAYLRRGRAPAGRPLLAKSRFAFDRALHARYGLVGWRHEQLSAASVWAEATEVSSDGVLLATWLVGTSHGHGRGCFDHDAAGLLMALPTDDPQVVDGNGWAEVIEAATTLFDDGAWDEFHARLSRTYGPWGLAYLEALLRSADQRMSAEGS